MYVACRLTGSRLPSWFSEDELRFYMQQIRSEKNTSPVLIVGLCLSLVAPTIYSALVGPVFLKPKVAGLGYNLIGFGVFWILALSVLGFTLLIEKQSLRTIGWQFISWKQALGAITIGVLLSLLVPVLTLLVRNIVPASQTGSIAEVTSSFPWWVILLSVITAGITEEILFRGYPLERLLGSNKNKWLSVGISLAFFVAIHATGWNLTHLIGVVIPLGLVLTGLYLWQRNLIFVMIVHLMIDLPLVIIALTT